MSLTWTGPLDVDLNAHDTPDDPDERYYDYDYYDPTPETETPAERREREEREYQDDLEFDEQERHGPLPATEDDYGRR